MYTIILRLNTFVLYGNKYFFRTKIITNNISEIIVFDKISIRLSELLFFKHKKLKPLNR